MREHSAPPSMDEPSSGSLTDDIVRNALEHPEAVAFSRGPSGRREPVTAAEFHEQVRALAKGLIASGIQAGDRVALLSRTRYEWTLFDYALWYVGGVSVPVYDTSPAIRVELILRDSGATGLVVESARHHDSLAEVQRGLPELSSLWTIDDGAVAELVSKGADVDDAVLDARRESGDPRNDRDPDLHLRHHGGPQGMRPHSRELHGRGDDGDRRPRGTVRRGRRPLCSSCPWHMSSPG